MKTFVNANIVLGSLLAMDSTVTAQWFPAPLQSLSFHYELPDQVVLMRTRSTVTHYVFHPVKSLFDMCMNLLLAWADLLRWCMQQWFKPKQSPGEANPSSGDSPAHEMWSVTGLMTARFICQMGTQLGMFFSSRAGPGLSSNAPQCLQLRENRIFLRL